MAILSWGEPIVEIAPFVNGVLPPNPTWAALPQIKQGTASLETEAGNESEALDEGGDVVDVRFGKSKYTFTCSVFIKKGDACPIANVDGVVTLNYALRLTPEDHAAMGFILPKCNVSVQETWSSEEGGLWVLTFSALKPEDGTTLQRWHGISLTPSKTDVAKAGETVTIAVDTPAASIASATSSPTSATTSISGKMVSVVVPNNTSTSAKTFTITVTDSNGVSDTVTLRQAGS